jgi:alpha-D-ribose 1-methylphosphonate 5-triphosphate diphosphatase
MDLRIADGDVLAGGKLAHVNLHVSAADGLISEIGADRTASATINAENLIVLPGIVDIHGDAFERQMMPRPGVNFSPDLALIDTDRQVIANGITTVFHSVTCSWEPGLRSASNARNMLAAIEALRFQLAADTKFHLRYEVFNLATEPEVCDWLDRRRIDALAFNDHLPPADKLPSNFSQMLERSGLNRDDFLMLVERLRFRGDEVPRSVGRLAERANASGVPLISHDDASPAARRWFRSLGSRVSEFPMNMETAQEAAIAGDQIVLGAPNVVRGKSHLGWIDASEMVSRGLCSILASDYYYPAPLAAAFRLYESGVAPLAKAWALICETPARAMKLHDRGRIEPGLRADLILVDGAVPMRPRVVAVLVAGRIVYLTEPGRILH